MHVQSTVGTDRFTVSKLQSAPPSLTPTRSGSTIEFLGIQKGFARNAEIYGEGEPADYLYKVMSGTVRTYKVRVDGRRQIGGFYGPGDMFGVEVGDEHAFAAEAVSDCRVLLINRSVVMARAARDVAVARELWSMIGHELERVQDHILLLIKSAEERVACFLLEMPVSKGNTIELPMSRQDIGEYLGLSLETVSRTFAHLQASAAIEVHSRQIVLRNRASLKRLNA